MLWTPSICGDSLKKNRATLPEREASGLEVSGLFEEADLVRFHKTLDTIDQHEARLWAGWIIILRYHSMMEL